MLRPLDPELQKVLGTEPKSCRRAASVLTTELSLHSPPPSCILLDDALGFLSVRQIPKRNTLNMGRISCGSQFQTP